MTNKEVLQTAQAKGYEPILCHIAKYGGSATLPHAVTDEASELCELALIQKWLRNEHRLIVSVSGKPFSYMVYKLFSKDVADCDNNYETYEDALLDGITAALNLI